MRGSLLPSDLRHNGRVLCGRKGFQRFTVGLIVGLVVLSLALTLVSGALAAPPRRRWAAQAPWATSPTRRRHLRPGNRQHGRPHTVTETPQGTSTQVTDEEHIGGLIAYILFMLGGVLLLRESAGSAASGSRQAARVDFVAPLTPCYCFPSSRR